MTKPAQKLASFALVAVLALAGVCVAQDEPRTYWYGIEVSDQLCGYATIEVSTVGEGDEAYMLIDQNMVISALLLGMDVDQKIDMTFHVDPETLKYTYSLIHIRADAVDMRREVTVEGDTASCTSSMFEGTTEIQLPPDVLLMNSVFLDHVKRDFVAGGLQEQSYRILDPERIDQPIQTVIFTKVGTETIDTPIGSLDTVSIDTLNTVTGAKTTLWVSTADGLVVRVTQPNGTLVNLADASVKDRIKRANVDDTILSRAETDIVDIHAISFMKVKASMEPVGAWLDHESLNIPGQSFEGSIEDNRIEGVFVIEHARYDGADAPPYPPDFSGDETLAKFLDASGLIESDDPVLIKKAREIAEGSADSWEAAKRLSSWVADNIGYEIPGGVFSRKVYDMRVGECGGHSVLLAAFCRAVGIPSRGVWGCMYSPLGGGSFGQHAWTEIYMGEAAGWVPVDSTAHEVDFVDSGHIRLGRFGDGGATGIALGAKSMEVLDYRLDEGMSPSAEASAAGKYVEYVGAYDAPKHDEHFQVVVKNGRLVVSVPGNITLPLDDPDAEGNWACSLTNLVYCTFQRDDTGQVESMTLHEIARLRRKSDPETIPDDVPEHLRRYLGGYYLPQANAEFDLIWDEGQLGFRDPFEGNIRHWTPGAEDGTWTMEDGTKVVSFIFDDEGEIISMSVDVSKTFPRQVADS